MNQTWDGSYVVRDENKVVRICLVKNLVVVSMEVATALPIGEMNDLASRSYLLDAGNKGSRHVRIQQKATHS
jgi:hypothetical protein